MKHLLRAIVPGVALILAPLQALAVDTSTSPKPVRQLVYTFTYNVSTDRTQHDSGIGGPVSGMADSRGGTEDKGTIRVDVLKVAADTGLLVSISETARETRSAQPVNCAVYGNTNFLCDGAKKINDEEIALLRLVGRNFVDANQIDDKNHWRVETDDKGGSSRVADFTVLSNDDGILKIAESRVDKQSGAQGFTATTDGKITYDLTHVVPTAVYENTLLRQELGMGDYETDQTQVTLALQSDSMGGK